MDGFFHYVVWCTSTASEKQNIKRLFHRHKQYMWYKKYALLLQRKKGICSHIQESGVRFCCLEERIILLYEKQWCPHCKGSWLWVECRQVFTLAAAAIFFLQCLPPSEKGKLRLKLEKRTEKWEKGNLGFVTGTSWEITLHLWICSCQLLFHTFGHFCGATFKATNSRDYFL